MSVSIPSRSRPRHPGLPTEDLFKLFRLAIKDHGDAGDPVIQSAYEDIVSYDHERARGVMELVVQRHPLAWSALCALLTEARDAHPKHEVHLAEIAADLLNQYPTSDIDRGLRQLIDWARYAGLFSYDGLTGVISLQGATSRRR